MLFVRQGKARSEGLLFSEDTLRSLIGMTTSGDEGGDGGIRASAANKLGAVPLVSVLMADSATFGDFLNRAS